jgi:hypothetical protein
MDLDSNFQLKKMNLYFEHYPWNLKRVYYFSDRKLVLKKQYVIKK